MFHILKGLKQIHAMNIFHGNLRLDTIIFSSSKKENEIFLINPKFTEDQYDYVREKLVKKGRNYFIAPEILEGRAFSPAIDMFALGCCIFFIIFGRYPYVSIDYRPPSKSSYTLDVQILEEMVQQKKRDPSSEQAVSVSCIDFLQRLIEVDPAQRITAVEGLKHHWFVKLIIKNQNKKKLKKFREMNGIPSLRTILECSELSEREISKLGSIINFGTGIGKTRQISSFKDLMYQDPDAPHTKDESVIPEIREEPKESQNCLEESEDSEQDEPGSEDEFNVRLKRERGPSLMMRQLHAVATTRYPIKHFGVVTDERDLFDPQLMRRTFDVLQPKNIDIEFIEEDPNDSDKVKSPNERLKLKFELELETREFQD